jgi:DNA-binding XRE family transcriptional regulator
MINENEAWIEDNFNLKDSEKFRIMIKVYDNLFINKESFAKKIGVGRSTVFNWLKTDRASFNIKSKTKICKGFKLLDTVWSEKFTTGDSFEQSLHEYKKIDAVKSREDVEKHILVKLDNIEIKENGMEVKSLSKKEITLLLENKLEKESVSFMFKFAKKLKSNKQIEEALIVLQWIDERESTFKYTHENELRRFKAVLLSHDNIKDWDEAIHILRSLYHSRSYHLEEPEILTLLASNYKRKALDGDDLKNKIDKEMITSALCLYEDAYNLKPDNAKYYDAINLAYLYNIVDVIEVEYADKIEIKALYKNLSQIWRIDTSNWWEVCSDAEFLMLLGKVDLAILKINEFLENYEVKPFEIDATVRQLKLYIKFSKDENAKNFLGYLEESLKHILILSKAKG